MKNMLFGRLVALPLILVTLWLAGQVLLIVKILLTVIAIVKYFRYWKSENTLQKVDNVFPGDLSDGTLGVAGQKKL